jgi:hypothetical protein
MTDTSVDDFLAHHGVLGMKWGHHKSSGGGSSSSGGGGKSAPAAKPIKKKPTTEEILAARQHMNAQEAKANKHLDAFVNATTDAGRQHASKLLTKAYDKINNDPQAAIAARKTGKEKAATILKVSGVIVGLGALALADSALKHL